MYRSLTNAVKKMTRVSGQRETIRSDGVKRGQARHVDVHHHDVRFQRDGLLGGGLRVPDMGHDLQVRLFFQAILE